MTAPADPPPLADHRVEQAETSDLPVLAQLIADAFFDLAVSRWLVPNPDARRAIFPGYFRLLAETALADGLVLTTPARDAAALWIPVGLDGPGETLEEYHEDLALLTGRHWARFEALDEAFERHHPVGVPHEHLSILAVRPDRQGVGTGTTLLHARHAALDEQRVPAYLEASDERTRGIYLDHGYIDLGEPIQLPGGPPMFPMWRAPRGDRVDAGPVPIAAQGSGDG